MTDLGIDPSRLDWLDRAEDFLAYYSFPRELIEDVLAHPATRVPDPNSGANGFRTEQFRRGDITVAVGFRDPTLPAVLYVHLHSPEEAAITAGAGSVKAGAGRGGSTVPTTWLALRRYLTNHLGCSLERDNAGHTKVLFGGQRIGSLPNTPHQDRREVANQFHTLTKRIGNLQQAQRVRAEWEQQQ